jgi:hypothetical protein
MNVSPCAVRRLPLAFTPGVFLSRAVASALTLTLFPIAYGGDSFFQPSARSPRRGEIIYFLLPDRFNDGNPSNNTGGLESGDPEETGFNPANPDFFHGGDLQGITGKLDYLRDLGATSIWMTPIF